MTTAQLAPYLDHICEFILEDGEMLHGTIEQHQDEYVFYSKDEKRPISPEQITSAEVVVRMDNPDHREDFNQAIRQSINQPPSKEDD